MKALLTNCKCEGRSFEERSCSNRSSSSKKPSSAVLAVSRDILRDRLDKTDSRLEDTRLSSRQFDSPTINKDDSEENIPEEALSEETPPSDETLSAEGIKRCNYLSWQGWSGCEGACGSEGKRKRSRVCPCRFVCLSTLQQILVSEAVMSKPKKKQKHVRQIHVFQLRTTRSIPLIKMNGLSSSSYKTALKLPSHSFNKTLFV